MAKKGKSGKKGKKGGSLSMKGRIFLIALILLGVIFLPTSLLLLVGMLPSGFAFIVGARGRGVRASTVAAMNLSGCMPYIFKLWASGNDFEVSIDILSDPQTIMIMYLAAAFGYMIDFVVTGLVSSYLFQKGVRRMRAIKERQKVIISHWGREVAGAHMEEGGEEEGEQKSEG
ncbi:MAG: hypothetical protein ACRBDL_01635 [Alphaproteobacteria bacterium]